MPEKPILSLYKKYTRSRNLFFSLEQFTSFLAFFPALLVAASDGIVDREEWFYCRKLAFGLGASYREIDGPEQDVELTQTYRKEFAYLLSHLSSWEEEFLEALECFFRLHPYAKKFVSQTAWLFADASNGISEEENVKMAYLCRRLQLDGADLQAFDELM